LSKANAHEFISEWPDQYETLVGAWSSVEWWSKQRIAIARPCLIDPRILILDEATSAYAESEHLVQEAIEKLVVGTHRLDAPLIASTHQNAQQIVVMDKSSDCRCW
jgi:ABC-type multidrug transport system fused ATPase/permease subunit